MEFVPVEVYANESPVGSAEELSSDADRDNNNTGDVASSAGRKHSGIKAPATSRLTHILEPDYLPPVPEKAAAFECFRVVADRGVFGGRHDGTIMHWKIQQSSSVTPLNVSHLRGHLGAVLTLEFCATLGKEGLLFSGSADRSIKIWDPWRGTEAEQQLHGSRNDHFCVQTLPAHQASVTCLKLLTQQQRPGLVSCSLDHTVKIWYTAEGRGLLLYPWFVPAQTISLSTTTCWPTSLCIRDAATSCSLFVGDSSGCVSHYTSGSSLGDDVDTKDAPTTKTATTGSSTSSSVVSSRLQFKLKRKHTQFHDLGVVQLQLISENNFVVSLGFDHKAHILDAMSGSVSSTIKNRNPTRFTCCAWDTRGGQWLFLADFVGCVHVWNVFQDKWVKKESMARRGTPLIALHLQPANDWLFIGVANGMKQWKINRDVGYGECTGHTDAIVAFAVLKDDVLIDSNQTTTSLSLSITTSSRFFSVSLDNTLRCWDAYDMKAAFGFEERLSEITCATPSKKFSKIVTGHERGFIKAWSIHTGQFTSAPLPSKSALTSLTTGMLRDQEFVFAGDVDGNLFLWELDVDSLSFTAAAQVSLTKDPTRRDEISTMLFCKGDFLNPLGGSEFLVIGYQNGYMAIWSCGKKQLLKSWKAHDDTVTSIARHGCFVFSGSDDTTLKIWNCIQLHDAYELAMLRLPGVSYSCGPGSPIVAVDVVQESGAVLCASADGTVVVWDYRDCEDKEGTDFGSFGKILYRGRHNVSLRCMQYWPSRKSMLCGSSEGRILVLALPPQVFHLHPVIS